MLAVKKVNKVILIYKSGFLPQFRVVIIDTQKIKNLFIVQLKKGHTNTPFRSLSSSEVIEKGVERPGDHASLWIFFDRDVTSGLALHSVSLSGSGLSISKNGAVVALHNLINERSYHSFVHVRLGGFGSEDAVKAEFLGQGGVGLLLDFHMVVGGGGQY